MSTNPYERKHAELTAIINDYDSKAGVIIDQLRAGDITQRGAEKTMGNWANQQRWNERLAEVEAFLEEVSTRSEAELAKLRTPEIKATTQEQLLAEMRGSRFWARAKAQLDAVGNGVLSGKAVDVAATASPEERAIFLQEIGAYLEVRDAPGAESVADRILSSDPAYAREKERAHGVARANAVLNSRLHAVRLEMATLNRNAPRRDLRIHGKRSSEHIPAPFTEKTSGEVWDTVLGAHVPLEGVMA